MDNESPLVNDLPQEIKSNEQINKLTMELLLNKNHYSKYLQHTDTKRFDEFKTFKSKLRKHSIDIIDITSDLVENPKKSINKDIEESFEIYVRSIIRYLEIKQGNNKEQQLENDEDVLFANMEEPDKEEEEDKEPTQSLWGKERVIKSKKISPADMHLFRPLKN
jgi:hypothetical protein